MKMVIVSDSYLVDGNWPDASSLTPRVFACCPVQFAMSIQMENEIGGLEEYMLHGVLKIYNENFVIFLPL